MKTLLASILVCAAAAPAGAGPDFTSRSVRPQPLAASTGSSEIGPFDDIVFETSSSKITDGGLAQIDTAARWLQRNNGSSSYRIVLEGYADAIGASVYNEDLATRRAFNVRQQLIGAGISPDRIIIVVYGETAAMGGEHPLDRRVVMYATKLAPQTIATASLDRKLALSVVWTQNKALFTESRTNRRRGTVIGTR